MNPGNSDKWQVQDGEDSVPPDTPSFIFVCITIGTAIVMTCITLIYAVFFVDQVDCKDSQHENIDALHAQGVGFVTIASMTLFVEVVFLIVAIVMYVKQKRDNKAQVQKSVEESRVFNLFMRLMYGLLVIMVVTWPSIGFGSLYMYPRASLDQLALDIYEGTEGQNDHWYNCFDKVNKNVKTGYYITAAGALILCWFAALAHSRLVFGTSIKKIMDYLSQRRVDGELIMSSLNTANANQREVVGYLCVTIIMLIAYVVTTGLSLKFQVEFQSQFSEGCNGNEHAFQRQTVTGVYLLIAALTSMMLNIVVSCVDCIYEYKTRDDFKEYKMINKLGPITDDDRKNNRTLTCRSYCNLIMVLRVLEYIMITICIITTVIACIGVWTFPFDTLRAVMADYTKSFASYTTSDMQGQYKDANDTFKNWTQCLDQLDVFGNKKKWFIMFSSVIVTQVGIIYIAAMPPIAKMFHKVHVDDTNEVGIEMGNMQKNNDTSSKPYLPKEETVFMTRSCTARRR
ncbi:hypothetical protein CYMTET_2651 [Cymbomonas tetramitiformis]|uniref:Uncharacterized protein n=1 Tax=Cymbomonas tetramitiformis TaxID=36881 RepID=A0AAE0LLV3_9CHLO|nr:hypothetical protein CYMTET_2651 [Cymbomonas tetramitiformis]